MITFLSGYKTYIIAALMVLIALVNLLTGDINSATFFNDPSFLLLLNGLGLGALRAAISKV
jgi:hypothetical protein